MDRVDGSNDFIYIGHLVLARRGRVTRSIREKMKVHEKLRNLTKQKFCRFLVMRVKSKIVCAIVLDNLYFLSKQWTYSATALTFLRHLFRNGGKKVKSFLSSKDSNSGGCMEMALCWTIGALLVYRQEIKGGCMK